MSEEFDPAIEAALIQAAAMLAVEASAFAERNARAETDMFNRHNQPIIDQPEVRDDPMGIVSDYFTDALVEVRDRYKLHLKSPRFSARVGPV